MSTTIRVTGVNGDSVTIAGENSGKEGIYLASGIEGFVDSKSEAVTKVYGNRPGSRLVRTRTPARSVTFTVTILNDGDVLEKDERWRRLWSYNKEATIEVTTELSGTRRLKCRLEEIKVDTEFDPEVMSAVDVHMSVTADNPFWYGEEFKQEVAVNTSATFTVDNANPTGVPIFPKWVVSAPGTWTLPDYAPGDGGQAKRSVGLPALSKGEDSVVDTDPGARQVMSDNKSLVWGRMNGVRFRGEIPPFTKKLTFTVKCSEPGKIQLRLERPFNRPWGNV